MTIQTVVEARRGCGYRKPGGLYLRVDGEGTYCGLLPIPVKSCPTCGEGIKPARGFTWVDIGKLASGSSCSTTESCGRCPLADAKIGRAGLIWIGEQFYRLPSDWLAEASRMGISRRITAIPRGFKVGETWVAVAHRRSFVPGGDPVIFHLFRPDRIEYVVKDSDTEEKLEAMEKRGITLIKVVRDIDQQPLPLVEAVN